MSVTSPTYQLSDAQWEQLRDLLPSNGKPGGQWKDHRLMIDGILWALSDGGRWRNLPDRFGPWQSVYDRFRRWTRKGLWDRLLLRLQASRRGHRPGTVLHRRERDPGPSVGRRSVGKNLGRQS